MGADKLAVVLLSVDPVIFKKREEYVPRAGKILARRKLDWPNAFAPKGFDDTMRAFNLSAYGNIVVDAKGIVRGVNLRHTDLGRLLEEVVAAKKIGKPGR